MKVTLMSKQGTFTIDIPGPHEAAPSLVTHCGEDYQLFSFSPHTTDEGETFYRLVYKQTGDTFASGTYPVAGRADLEAAG